jgi:hypothetical protein
MLNKRERTAGVRSRNGAKKLFLFLFVFLMLTVSVAARRCTRETQHVATRQYGGQTYQDFVSCGSSAGNFGYSCDSVGRCYENPNLDTSVCHCDDEMLTQ